MRSNTTCLRILIYSYNFPQYPGSKSCLLPSASAAERGGNGSDRLEGGNCRTSLPNFFSRPDFRNVFTRFHLALFDSDNLLSTGKLLSASGVQAPFFECCQGISTLYRERNGVGRTGIVNPENPGRVFVRHDEAGILQEI
jgi:hypothetical protein